MRLNIFTNFHPHFRYMSHDMAILKKFRDIVKSFQTPFHRNESKSPFGCELCEILMCHCVYEQKLCLYETCTF